MDTPSGGSILSDLTLSTSPFRRPCWW